MSTEKKIKKDVESLKESVNELKNNSNSLSNAPINNPSKPSITRFAEIVGIIAFLYFFGQSVVTFFFPLFEMIYSGLVILDSSILFPRIFNIAAIIITILLYYNVFVYGIWQTITKGFTKALENCSNNIQKWQSWIIIPVVLILGIEIFFLSSTTTGETASYTFGETTEEVGSQANSTFSKFLDEIQCSFNPQCFLQQQNKQQDTQTEDASYNIDIDQSLTTYRKSQLESRQIPIELSVQSRGGNMFLDKLECYRATVEEENLIDTYEFSNEEIENSNLQTIGGVRCDLSSLEINETQDIRIVTLLHYRLDLDYTQQIPLVDFNKYREENDDEITENELKNSIDIPTPKNTATNALSITRNINPPFPIILNLPGASYPSFFMDLTFEKTNTNLGEINSTKLTQIEYPQNYIRFKDIETPLTIDSFDGITETSFEFEPASSSLSQEESPQVTFPVKMKFENQLTKEKTLEFTIINNDE